MTTDAPQKKSYKETLNLPQTGFPMQAELVKNEPKRLQQWKDERLYEKLQTARAGAPKWILHDGPPFANGDIHIGHVINKTLKDVFLRFKTMQGFQTPYVPGWDCHGLPIEHKIQEELKKEGKHFREVETLDVRKRCFEYASKYVKVQSEQFQRLGILGEWENPYLTMAPRYEAATLEVFARFVEAGLVYKKLKPVSWSVVNQTALADAELEYKDITDPSVYVEFQVEPSSDLAKTVGGDWPFFFLVWTTTPWTLPANLAIAVGPEVRYVVVEYVKNGEARLGIVAHELVERVFKGRAGVTSFSVTDKSFTGEELSARAEYLHPFIEYKGRILTADYVTTTDGTGLVHTAPGHGEDDYETGVKHGLETYSPVLANGRFDDTVPEFLRGKSTKEGNPLIIEELKTRGKLLAVENITHSYPHDWRSKTPILFRATEQWFVAMDKPFKADGDPAGLEPKSLRDRARTAVSFDPEHPQTPEQKAAVEDYEALQAEAAREDMEARSSGISPKTLTRHEERELFQRLQPGWDLLAKTQVRFVPKWGESRLNGMLQSRPDWCVSRQRAWGLPIPVFYNEKGEPLLTAASVRAVAKRFAEKGSDAWFTEEPAELLGSDFRYPPGFSRDNLRKEKDIFDVWFESGSSWNAVLRDRSYLQFPADLYLEGSDQHRGWFQLSLLPALGATGQPPFKQVLTHGFIVKTDGTKVSKSDKEYVTATQEIERHGADLLRLWCCSVDYQGDIPTSPQVIKEFGDKYRKIRNTLRYLLSNLYDFNPHTDAVEVPANSLDGWASSELDALIRDVVASYESYQTHNAFKRLFEFCNVQISAVYGNAMKDRLYCEAVNSPLRRRSQTVMYRMAVALTKLLAPMIVFTADEAWEHLQHRPVGEEKLFSVHLAKLPEPLGGEPSEDQKQEWKRLFDLRDAALLQLDALKKEKGVNKALDAEVIFKVDDDATRRSLQAYGVDLQDMVGAGFHFFAEKGTAGPAVTVEVVDRRETYPACARSWKRRPDVGSDPAYPDLSLRDALVVGATPASPMPR